MKPIIKKLFLIIMFLPFIVNASEKCSVISGTGKNIGDEIACGTEHFYVIENKDNSVKMLAKYNLNVGDKIDYFDVENDTVYLPDYMDLYGEDSYDYCIVAATAKGYNPYYTYPMFEQQEDHTYKMKGCRVYEQMNEPNVRQDSRAIGTKLVNGKSVMPLYGITYMDPNWGYEAKVNNNIHDVNYDTNGNMITTNTPFEGYLTGYKNELHNQGIDVSTISFVTLDRILSLIKTISGRELEIELEYPEFDNNSNSVEQFIGKMEITDYVSEEYNWIYSVTYWLGTGFITNDPSSFVQYNDYYISNEGMLCALGRGTCTYLAYPIGNGVRPFVEMSEDNLTYPYNIESETDGNGSIDVVDKAYSNDVITFRVQARQNYVISSITIIDKDGNSVTYNQDQIVQNDDGTVSVNSFTMPSNDVKIVATFEVKKTSTIEEIIVNPKTGVVRPSFILFIVLLIGLITHLVLSKKKMVAME